jgi:hypothetical protein
VNYNIDQFLLCQIEFISKYCHFNHRNAHHPQHWKLEVPPYTVLYIGIRHTEELVYCWYMVLCCECSCSWLSFLEINQEPTIPHWSQNRDKHFSAWSWRTRHPFHWRTMLIFIPLECLQEPCGGCISVFLTCVLDNKSRTNIMLPFFILRPILSRLFTFL